MRDSGLLWPDSCAKKRRANIALAQPRAARASLPFECNAGRPLAARSAFRRQRMVPFRAPRFAGAGSAAALEHAAAPPTPCVCASVGRFSFGDSGAVFPTVFTPCSGVTVTAGPRTPFVGSALTTPPPVFGAGFGADCDPYVPPPPPQATSATALTSVASATKSLLIPLILPSRGPSRIGRPA